MKLQASCCMSAFVDSSMEYQRGVTYPTEMILAINKAKTVSWRLGVAWTLVSESGEVLKCNGNLFNQHNQTLIDDLELFSHAYKLFISYCPLLTDLNSDALLETLRISNLVEIHVCTLDKDRHSIDTLSVKTAIPALLWPSDHTQSAHTTGIAWVRSSQRPWVHIVCSNSLGGGAFPLEKMSEQLGVIPYVTLKGVESSLLYVQNDRSNSFEIQLRMADPQFVVCSKKLVQCLNDLSGDNASIVTVVCDPSWLALIIKLGLANEVSYFLSLRSTAMDAPVASPIVEFPESDQWTINSSEVMGDFMQVVLQKG